MFQSFNQSNQPEAPWAYLPRELIEPFPSVTTFNDSEYVQRLNVALQLETLAVKVYSQLQKLDEPAAMERSCLHQHSSRQIIRMVIAQRGVPEERPTSLLTLIQAAALQAVELMPSNVQKRLLGRMGVRLARQLKRTYLNLIPIAPPQDVETIRDLMTHCDS